MKFFKKLPPAIQGILLFGGLMLTIFAIPMGYITIKKQIRKMQWESTKDERRPQLEADFADYKLDAQLVHQHLHKLADQVALAAPYQTTADMPEQIRAVFDSLSYLKKGGISPFLEPLEVMPQLEENAFFAKAKDSQKEKFIYDASGYCGKRVFYRIENGDWDAEAFHQNPEVEYDIPTCMKSVANSKYFLI